MTDTPESYERLNLMIVKSSRLQKHLEMINKIDNWIVFDINVSIFVASAHLSVDQAAFLLNQTHVIDNEFRVETNY